MCNIYIYTSKSYKKCLWYAAFAFIYNFFDEFNVYFFLTNWESPLYMYFLVYIKNPLSSLILLSFIYSLTYCKTVSAKSIFATYLYNIICNKHRALELSFLNIRFFFGNLFYALYKCIISNNIQCKFLIIAINCHCSYSIHS